VFLVGVLIILTEKFLYIKKRGFFRLFPAAITTFTNLIIYKYNLDKIHVLRRV